MYNLFIELIDNPSHHKTSHLSIIKRVLVLLLIKLINILLETL